MGATSKPIKMPSLLWRTNALTLPRWCPDDIPLAHTTRPAMFLAERLKRLNAMWVWIVSSCIFTLFCSNFMFIKLKTSIETGWFLGRNFRSYGYPYHPTNHKPMPNLPLQPLVNLRSPLSEKLHVIPRLALERENWGTSDRQWHSDCLTFLVAVRNGHIDTLQVRQSQNGPNKKDQFMSKAQSPEFF